MNEHDSRKISAVLSARGYGATDSMDDADLILFNTCTIREKAQQKAVSDIGRTAILKSKRPDVKVAVCGCVAQQEQEALFERFPQIDMLFGPDQIPALPKLLDTVSAEQKQVSALQLINTTEDYEFLNLVPWADERPQASTNPTAFVTIMKGCDSNCAYCIVPRVRGVEVCRPADDIIAEVKQLVERRAVREVTLLGQTVNTYGSRRHQGVIPFPELLRRIAEETEIARIRFTSPHPKDLNTALVEEYRDNPKLCNHMHLPLQSGCDNVLRSMRRSYSTKHFKAKVEELRAAVPDVAISTDMIVGFPGETAADFEKTLRFCEEIGFDSMYAFAYSPRPGTESFNHMEDNVTPEEKKDRLARLLDLNERLVESKLAAKVGCEYAVLLEGQDKSGTKMTGRTEHNSIVHVEGEGLHVGDIVKAKVTQRFGYSLAGELVSE